MRAAASEVCCERLPRSLRKQGALIRTLRMHKRARTLSWTWQPACRSPMELRSIPRQPACRSLMELSPLCSGRRKADVHWTSCASIPRQGAVSDRMARSARSIVLKHPCTPIDYESRNDAGRREAMRQWPSIT